MVLTRRRRVIFAAIAMAIPLIATTVIILATDLYLHHRAERSAGLNRWGYRGPVAGRPQSEEVRIVMLGGSTVFGYGVPWNEAAPALLEDELRRARPSQPISVINLGYNNEGAFAALPNLQDYRYLDYNVVVLYQGYNDRMSDGNPNETIYRRQSPVFRLTGYVPILPLLLREKAMQLSGAGAYVAESGDRRPVFSPSLATRTSVAAIQSARAIGEALASQLDRVAIRSEVPRTFGGECAPPWSHFCAAMIRAIEYSRQQGAKVLVVTQPLDQRPDANPEEKYQQASLIAAVTRMFNAVDVQILDLSSAIDLTDRDLSFDGMHLGLDGNRKLAQLMAPAVERLVWQR